MALKRACEAVPSGAPTTNPLFVVAIWTCAAARAAIIDEFGTVMAVVLSAGKLIHYFLVLLLVRVKAVRTTVWMPQSGEFLRLVELALRQLRVGELQLFFLSRAESRQLP